MCEWQSPAEEVAARTRGGSRRCRNCARPIFSLSLGPALCQRNVFWLRYVSGCAEFYRFIAARSVPRSPPSEGRWEGGAAFNIASMTSHAHGSFQQLSVSGVVFVLPFCGISAFVGVVS